MKDNKRENINRCLSYDFIFDINDKNHIEEIFSILEELGFTIKYEDNDMHYYIIDSFTMTVYPIEDDYPFIQICGIISNKIFVRLLRYIFYIGDITDVLNAVIINCNSFTVEAEVGKRLKRMLVHYKTVGVSTNLLCYKDDKNIESMFQREEDYKVADKINSGIFLQIYDIWKIMK